MMHAQVPYSRVLSSVQPGQLPRYALPPEFAKLSMEALFLWLLGRGVFLVDAQPYS